MDIPELKVGSPVPKPATPVSETEINKSWDSASDKPLVSILCHCFNHENYIEDALNGILMQRTDFPWEVIVHDDASTDGSAAVIKRYAEQYPNIIKPVFQQENQFSKGRKPTLFTSKVARGEFIAVCEGDDFWLDERKLQIQADFLRANPEYSVCGHDAFTFEGGKVVTVSKLPEESKTDASGFTLSRGWFILTLTAMFRADFDVFPEEQANTLNADAFVFSRLGKVGSYKYMPDLAPGAYRSHPGGIWSQVDQKKRAAHGLNSMYWVSQYYKRVGDSELSVHYAQQISLKALEDADEMSLREFLAFSYSLINQFVRKRYVRLYGFLTKLKKTISS